MSREFELRFSGDEMGSSSNALVHVLFMHFISIVHVSVCE